MKKLFSLIACLTMVFSLCMLPVNAAEKTLESILDEALNTTETSVIVTLNEDVTWTTGAGHGSTPLLPSDSTVKTLTIEGNSTYTLEAIGQGVGSLRAANGGTLIFKNLTIKDSSVSYAEGSWELGYLEFSGNIKFVNCQFENAISVDSDNGQSEDVNVQFIDCQFNSNKSKEYAVWVSNGNVTFDGCSFTGPRGLKVHEAYGSEVESVIVTNTEFKDITEKPGIALGDLNADTEVSVINCTFENCKEGDQGSTIVESDTATDTFRYTVKETVNDVYSIETVVTTEEQLRKAISSGKEVIAIDENIKLNKNLPFIANSSVTLIGLDGDEVLDMNSTNNTASNCEVLFEDLTIKVINDNYKGLQHSKSESYFNCVIEGTLWLYGTESYFDGCTFIQTNPNLYNVWTYGSKQVIFDSCVFETAGKSVLVYNEGSVGSSDVSFVGCEFTANDQYSEQNKAAVEIDSSLIPGEYTVYFYNTTVDEQITSGLFRDKKSKNNLNVVLDGIPVVGDSKPVAINGGILVDTTDEAGICFELVNLPTDDKYTYTVKLYSGETYLTYKEIELQSEGILTCSFYTVGTSSSWTQDEWTAYEAVMPTHAVFYINDVEIGTDEVDFTKEQWLAFAGVNCDEELDIVGKVDVTCTKNGYTGDKVCGTCGETVEEGTVVEATGHVNTKTINAKEPTCTEEGYTGDVICKDCETIITKGAVIKATGHTYVDGKCSVCNEEADKQPTTPTTPDKKPTNTGDNTNIALYASLAVIALGSVIVLRKKEQA